MNSTTLPPLKPRNNKLYGGVGGGGMSNAANSNLNATIATSNIRPSKMDAGGGGGGGGRNSSGSNGIQVQQLYDNSTLNGGSHKNYLASFHHNNNSNYHNSNNINHSTTTSNLNLNNNNNNNFSQQNGAKSPSAESLNSNKSVTQTNLTQTINTKNSHQNTISLSTNQQANGNNNQQSAQQLNSTSMRRTTNPMTPETAMKNYMQKLTSFEHHEIFNYPEIYFLGQNAKKIHGVIGGANNNGYDDENGNFNVPFIFRLTQIHFNLNL